MRGGKAILVINLAIRGPPVVVGRAVPAREAGLRVDGTGVLVLLSLALFGFVARFRLAGFAGLRRLALRRWRRDMDLRALLPAATGEQNGKQQDRGN